MLETYFHYVYFSNIYPQSQLIIFISLLYSLFTTCFGPYGPSSGETQHNKDNLYIFILYYHYPHIYTLSFWNNFETSFSSKERSKVCDKLVATQLFRHPRGQTPWHSYSFSISINIRLRYTSIIRSCACLGQANVLYEIFDKLAKEMALCDLCLVLSHILLGIRPLEFVTVKVKFSFDLIN
jgi:hypothetical protein